MTTRPTDTPEWATTGTVTEPAAAKQAAGWLFQDRPPFDWVNWAWSRFSLWASHVASTSSKVSVEGAFAVPATAPLAFGDSFIADENDLDAGAGEVAVADIVTPVIGATSRTVAAIGREVLYCNGTTGVTTAHPRTGGAVIRTYTPATAGVSVMVADDDVVVVWRITGGGGELECFDRATGASLFTFAHGAALLGVALGIDRVYLCGANPGAGEYVRALSISGAGAVVWDFDHGAQVEALAVYGSYVYLHGAASIHATTATMRAIQASNGFGATAEGGLGASTLPGVWDQVTAGTPGTRFGLATDGRILATINGNDLVTRGCANGVAAVTLTGALPGSGKGVLLDDEFVYGFDSTFDLMAYSRMDNLAAAWRYVPPSGVFSGLSSDGGAVFVANSTASPEATPRLRRGNRPRLWWRVDPATYAGSPYRRGVI